MRQKSDENVRETAQQSPRQWGRMRRRCCRHQRTFSGHLWRRPQRQRLAPCSLWKNTVEQISTLQSKEDVMTQETNLPWKKQQPTESPRIFCEELWALGDLCWSTPFLKDCMLRNELKLEQVLKNNSSKEKLMLKQLTKDCILWEGPQAGPGKECKDEGEVETKCYELITAHTAWPSVLLGREGNRRIRNEGVKLSLGWAFLWPNDMHYMRNQVRACRFIRTTPVSHKKRNPSQPVLDLISPPKASRIKAFNTQMYSETTDS